MNEIKQLSYLVFESEKLDEWKRFMGEFLGMQIIPVDENSFKVKMDNYGYRFLITRGAREDVATVGFQVANQAALRAVEKRLVENGVEVTHVSGHELELKEVQELIRFQDPEGLLLEVSYNPRISDDAELPIIKGGFITNEEGMGHIAITVADLAKGEAFYRDILGFRLSDYIEQNIQGIPIRFTFFHCNPRHHTLALAGVPVPFRLHHFMVEVKDIDLVGKAYERAQQMDIPIHMALGRHPNDRMFSFYAKTPCEFNVEFGAGGLQILNDDTWDIRTYDTISEWGHKF